MVILTCDLLQDLLKKTRQFFSIFGFYQLLVFLTASCLMALNDGIKKFYKKILGHY